jgi:hypothetical protein
LRPPDSSGTTADGRGFGQSLDDEFGERTI